MSFYLVQPWAHQREAVEKARNLRDYGLFFEMGAGKTMTAINIARYKYWLNKRILRTLVLCPIVVTENWKREFKTHSRVAAETAIIKGTKEKKLRIINNSGSKIFITNYETLTSEEIYKELLCWQPELIIFDESHRLKSLKAKRTKKAYQLAKGARHRYLLTGTPILNTPMDIFSQFLCLDLGESFDRNFIAFRERYFVDKNSGMPAEKYFPNWQPRPGLDEEFNKIIYQKAMRVTKEECMDLPPLNAIEIGVEMAKEQTKAYNEMHDEFITYIKDKACVAQLALTKLLRLQQIVSGHMKLDDGTTHTFKNSNRLGAMLDLLEDIIPSGKVIIWTNFKATYKPISEAIEAKFKGVGICWIVGGMSDKARNESIDDFQNKPECKIMIANQQAGGTGVNLTAAKYSVYFSRNYSLEADLQSKARNHRGGSEIHSSITHYHLVTYKTVDEAIMNALKHKVNLAEDILRIRDFL